MNPATFRTLNEAIGLTADHYAHTLGINPRTTERWFGKVPPNERALNYLSTALQAFDGIVQQLAERDTIQTFLNEHAYKQVTQANMPYGMYQAAVRQAATQIALKGGDPDVRFINAQGEDFTVLSIDHGEEKQNTP